MPGYANFTVSFECPAQDCSLTLWLDNDLWYHTFSDGNSASTSSTCIVWCCFIDCPNLLTLPFLLAWTVPVIPGNHTFSLDFSRWVPWLTSHDHEGTRAILHSVDFVGTVVGGAPECTLCPAGKVIPYLFKARISISPHSFVFFFV